MWYNKASRHVKWQTRRFVGHPVVRGLNKGHLHSFDDFALSWLLDALYPHAHLSGQLSTLVAGSNSELLSSSSSLSRCVRKLP